MGAVGIAAGGARSLAMPEVPFELSTEAPPGLAGTTVAARERQADTTMMRLTDSVVVEDHDIKERFVRAMGPGGQNLNKEATAVELSIHLGGSSRPADVKERLAVLAGRHVKKKGVLVVVSRAHRSQAKNRETARARLVALLKRAANRPAERWTMRPGATARKERLLSKHRKGEVKRLRSGRDED